MPHQVPIIMPQLGESIAEATIVNILHQEGAHVEADCNLMEVETHKAMMEVTAQCSGKVTGLLARAGQSYPVGAILGYIEVADSEAQRLGIHKEPIPTRPKSGHTISVASEILMAPAGRVRPTVKGLPVPAHAVGASYLSPRMKARMAELGLHAADLAGIAGSGAGGRVTIDDLERFLSDLERNKITSASTMRVAVADAMRRSWTRPLATVVLPVNMDPLLTHRKKQKLKPGPALYALRALALALSENSAAGGRLVGDRIIHPRSIDIGFAVEAEDGVLVPVIRNAEQYRLMDLVERYNRLVHLARQRKLPAQETGGSIATVTNYGVFGLTLATPIPLPEQTLLLGMGAGQIRPHWNSETQEWSPITISEFTLSFDHRVIDGGAAGRLLKRIEQLLLDPSNI
ncbi:MAG: dihydrolipoamide acetyltransferase [Verrucomicrobia bacterium]|nr:MAG: dihydrolipoamide acetyltransferase [Verrucomicrobiota bacterium]